MYGKVLRKICKKDLNFASKAWLEGFQMDVSPFLEHAVYVHYTFREQVVLTPVFKVKRKGKSKTEGKLA